MIQFISIILRKDIKNEKYLKHVKEQMELIKFLILFYSYLIFRPEDISQAIVTLLKNCPNEASL